MNQERRNRLTKVEYKIDQAKELLEAIHDEEESYYDNMPESLQSSEKGNVSQSAIDSIDSAITSLSEAMSSIEEACIT